VERSGSEREHKTVPGVWTPPERQGECRTERRVGNTKRACEDQEKEREDLAVGGSAEVAALS
jgi:hypothetical protein